MSSALRAINQGFDHVEFVVNDLNKHESMYQRMGFEKVGERRVAKTGDYSVLYAQGFARILLTKPGTKSLFLDKHGDGVNVLAIEVSNARETYDAVVAAGARSAMPPVEYKSEYGTVIRAEVWTPEDIRYALIERKLPHGVKSKGLFDDGLVADRLESPSPLGIRLIDHLTNNVDLKQMDKWVGFYRQCFGFVTTRHFEISTGRTGLISDVVQSLDGKIKVPVNEATEPESQVQEFVNRFNGAGVQHLAFLTTDIINLLTTLRSRDFKFLSVPPTYYENVPKRVPSFSEDLKELEKLQILLDGEGEGYLLQIFSEEMVGPFFFEFIQRKGNNGFGEGNFKALFEAIEKDQIKRGTLK